MEVPNMKVKKRITSSRLLVHVEHSDTGMLHRLARNIPTDKETQVIYRRPAQHVDVITTVDRQSSIDSYILLAAIECGIAIEEEIER